MAIPGHLEAAFGADRTADPLSWTWTDLTTRTQQNAVTIGRGRRTGAASQAEPASMSVLLDNGDGALTPRKATSTYYPNVRRGTPVRHYVNTGARYLACTGASGSDATTPDAASWNIGADLAVAIQFRAPVRLPAIGDTYQITGQFNPTGNQRSWMVFISTTGAGGLRVSSNGTNEFDSGSTLAIPSPDAGPLTLALEFDGDNGASGNTTTWYLLKGTIATLVADKTAYTFGAPDVNSGTITLFNSTGTVGIGDVPGSGFLPYPGAIDAVLVRAGTLTTGTLVANPDFTTQTAGAGSFADTATAPKTWTINSPAAITDRKVRLLGTLDSAELTYPGQSASNTAQVEWTVSGPLRRMRQGAEALKSALYRRITAPLTDTTVYAYWPLEDGRDTTSLFTIGGSPGGTMAMDLASDDTLNSSSPLPSAAGGQPFGWNLSMPPAAPATGWEMTMLVYIPVAPSSGASEFLDLQRIDTVNGTTTQWVVRIDDANWRVFAKDETSANVLSASGAADARMFGDWMIVTLTVAQDGADIDWDLDLIPLSVGAAFGGSGTLASFTLGSPTGLRTLHASAPQEGLSVGHFIVTAGAIPGWLAPADTAYTGEPAPARVFRLCRELDIPVLVDGPHRSGVLSGWPASIAAGAQPMGPQRPLPLLALLEECAAVDNGFIGETRELLGITYRSGCTQQNQTARLSVTSEVTGPLLPVDDDRDLVNDATVSRVNGSSAQFTDDASITADGLYEDSREVNAHSDLDLPDLASWWVHEATWPDLRYPEIPIELAKNTAKFDDWHSLSAGDVITATSLPSAQPETSLTQIVDGWTEEVSPHLHTLKLNTRPEGPWQVAILEDAALGKLDTYGSTLSSGINSSATSLSVATTLGPLWDPADAEDGFAIVIGGERMTVTDISGTSSPQTFTVTRSVNGVVKSHSSGAAVSLWRPSVIAL